MSGENKDSMTRFAVIRRTAGGPVILQDLERNHRLDKCEDGDVVKAKVVVPRRIESHNLLQAAMKEAFKSLPERMVLKDTIFYTFEGFYEWVKAEVGFVRIVRYRFQGEEIERRYPKSYKFTECGQDEFDDFFQPVLDKLAWVLGFKDSGEMMDHFIRIWEEHRVARAMLGKAIKSYKLKQGAKYEPKG